MMAITASSFAQPTRQSMAEFAALSSTEAGTKDLLNALLMYLQGWSHQPWVDSEKLYVLGRQMASQMPSTFINAATTVITENVNLEVSRPFLLGLISRREPDAANTSVHPNQWRRIIRDISKEGAEKHGRALAETSRKHQRYAENTGDCASLVWFQIEAIRALLKVRGSRKVRAETLLSLVEDALVWQPNSPVVLQAWAEAYLLRNQFESAETVLLEGILRRPDISSLRNSLANVWLSFSGRLAEASALARETLSLFPGDQYATNILARSLGDMGDAASIREGINMLVAAIPTAPKKSRDFHTKVVGQLLALKASREDILHVTQSIPRDLILWGMLGWNIYTAGGIEQSIIFFREASRVFPSELSITNQLSSALLETGRTEDRMEALSILRKNIRLSADDSHSRYHLGRALVSSPDKRERLLGSRFLKVAGHRFKDDPRFTTLLHMIQEDTAQISLRDSARVLLPRGSGRSSYEAGHTVVAGLPSDEQHDRLLPYPSDEISVRARFRFLRLRIDLFEDPEAVRELVELHENNPSSQYGNLLYVRYVGDDDHNTTFSFAFERALRDHDPETLDHLSRTYPHFEALTWLAKSLLGDAEATRQIADWASSPGNGVTSMAVIGLRNQLRPFLHVIQGGRVGEASEDDQRAIRSVAYNVNEIAAGPFWFAAAA